MDGILVVDKNSGCTSRDIVNILCKKFKTKKIGHTGTLDPLATGILVVLIGKYTSLVEIVTSYNKTYEADVELGTLTNTLDISGQVLKEESVHIDKNQLVETLKSMIGSYEQTVPIFSAVKIKGRKLYEYARSNEVVELPKRNVEIKSIELIDDVTYINNKTHFKIRCEVSKGTYIRALVNDIASKLNTFGTMTSLRRIAQGEFQINQAYTIEEIINDKYEFIDINDCLKNLTTVEVDDNLLFKIKNGQTLPNEYEHDLIAFAYNKKIVAIYKNDNNILKMWKYLF